MMIDPFWNSEARVARYYSHDIMTACFFAVVSELWHDVRNSYFVDEF
jgi:hypothetical protein